MASKREHVYKQLQFKKCISHRHAIADSYLSSHTYPSFEFQKTKEIARPQSLPGCCFAKWYDLKSKVGKFTDQLSAPLLRISNFTQDFVLRVCKCICRELFLELSFGTHKAREEVDIPGMTFSDNQFYAKKMRKVLCKNLK